MLGDGFEQSTILRTGPDGLTRVITRTSWDRRESVLVEAGEAELVVLRRWSEFHQKALGFAPRWNHSRLSSSHRSRVLTVVGAGRSPVMPTSWEVWWKTQKFEPTPYVGKLYFDVLAPTIRGLANE
jgi:hypothetical protein